MKATGEVMSIDRSYESALMKAIRSMEIGMHSLRHKNANIWTAMEIEEKIRVPNDERLFVIAEAYRRGMMEEEIAELSNIDPWFLRGIERLVNMESKVRDAAAEFRELAASDIAGVMRENSIVKLLWEAKKLGFPDRLIAELVAWMRCGFGSSENLSESSRLTRWSIPAPLSSRLRRLISTLVMRMRTRPNISCRWASRKRRLNVRRQS